MSFRFALDERPDIGVVTQAERDAILRRLSEDDGLSCCKTMHMGFFFDGTRNNADHDRPVHKHSNVARLFDTYPLDNYHYPIYIAGVGTRFANEIGDQGAGLQAAAGAATGWAGEGRINWALLQIHNIVHAHVLGTSLSVALGKTDKDIAKAMSADLNFVGMALGSNPPAPGSIRDINARASAGSGALTMMVSEHTGTELRWDRDTVWAQLWKDTVNSKNWKQALQVWDQSRRKILAERRAQLNARVGNKLTAGKPKLQRIRLSVFGFSRGSAEARTFCNWLVDALDDGFTLCGVPVTVDFLGIFDTVASVGIAQGAAATLFDGHGGWGRAENMAVPFHVRRCVHMVAAHEPRGSFPLDLIDHATGDREEIVYPGVHSDVGGGYGAAEQGRGQSDSDKLSQVPLLDMYREARKAGVPLDIKGPGIAPRAVDAFKISAGLKEAFSAYVKTSAGYFSVAENGTPGLMRTHYGLYLRWRKQRLTDLKAQPSFKAAQAGYPQDAVDLDSANEELRAEWQDLLESEKDGGPSLARYAMEGGADFVRSHPKLAATLSPMMLPASVFLGPLVAPFAPDAVKAAKALLEEKWQQWLEVRTDWNMDAPEKPISALYDNYMHDSRAWFKPLGADDDVWNYEQIKALKDKQAAFERQHAAWQAQSKVVMPASYSGYPAVMVGPEPKSPLTAQETDQLKRYDSAMQSAQTARQAKDPSAPSDSAVLTDPKVSKGLAFQKSGREFYFLWGYLRWRTVYINGVRWDAPHVRTVQENQEDERKAMQQRVDMQGLSGIFH
ncbi:DUF2235 domain-containing protein [Paraburkholderia fungorum]|uniref:Type VI secretion system protein n=1 Tax=Paraburkholderia fungorum TaxID=134537 RepID=A0A420GH76_9BURK|nr:DUF2235 domain-containing protein [Paraburkholderia fungorum]RKF44507.1 type VI secretion system protein [Paraburkholderia fungorum]